MVGCFSAFLHLFDQGFDGITRMLTKTFGIQLIAKPEFRAGDHGDPMTLGELFHQNDMGVQGDFNMDALCAFTRFDKAESLEVKEIYDQLQEADFQGVSLAYQLLSRSGIHPQLVKIICTTLKPTEEVFFPVMLAIIGVFDRGTPAEKLALIFSMFDYDGSGALSNEEVTEIITAVSGENLTESEVDHVVEELFAEIDANGDGEIQFEEFIGAYPMIVQLLKLEEDLEVDAHIDPLDNYDIDGFGYGLDHHAEASDGAYAVHPYTTDYPEDAVGGSGVGSGVDDTTSGPYTPTSHSHLLLPAHAPPHPPAAAGDEHHYHHHAVAPQYQVYLESTGSSAAVWHRADGCGAEDVHTDGSDGEGFPHHPHGYPGGDAAVDDGRVLRQRRGHGSVLGVVVEDGSAGADGGGAVPSTTRTAPARKYSTPYAQGGAPPRRQSHGGALRKGDDSAVLFKSESEESVTTYRSRLLAGTELGAALHSAKSTGRPHKAERTEKLAEQLQSVKGRGPGNSMMNLRATRQMDENERRAFQTAFEEARRERLREVGMRIGGAQMCLAATVLKTAWLRTAFEADGGGHSDTGSVQTSSPTRGGIVAGHGVHPAGGSGRAPHWAARSHKHGAGGAGGSPSAHRRRSTLLMSPVAQYMGSPVAPPTPGTTTTPTTTATASTHDDRDGALFRGISTISMPVPMRGNGNANGGAAGAGAVPHRGVGGARWQAAAGEGGSPGSAYVQVVDSPPQPRVPSPRTPQRQPPAVLLPPPGAGVSEGCPSPRTPRSPLPGLATQPSLLLPVSPRNGGSGGGERVSPTASRSSLNAHAAGGGSRRDTRRVSYASSGHSFGFSNHGSLKDPAPPASGRRSQHGLAVISSFGDLGVMYGSDDGSDTSGGRPHRRCSRHNSTHAPLPGQMQLGPGGERQES